MVIRLHPSIIGGVETVLDLDAWLKKAEKPYHHDKIAGGVFFLLGDYIIGMLGPTVQQKVVGMFK